MIGLIKKDLRDNLKERERFWQAQRAALPDNCVVLNTCDRVEVYFGSGEIPDEIMRHLFRVTAGLESALLGETAIQGQVKEAYLAAQAKYPLSREIHWLFQSSLRIGKRVRSETNISRGAVSHGQAVVEILKMRGIDIARSQILIIGASNLNETIIKYFVKMGNKTTFVASRNYRKAAALGAKYHCPVVLFSELGMVLPTVGIVISATSAPHYILRKKDLSCCQEIMIFDLAFPRDIDPEIGENSKVTLLNVEDIEQIVNQNRWHRQEEVSRAEQIINEELKKYYVAN